jgi:hypothetical protein
VRAASAVTFDFEDLWRDNAEVNLHDRVYGGVGRNFLQSFTTDVCSQNPQGCFIFLAHHFSPEANPPCFATLGTQRRDFAGSTALVHHRSGGEIVLSRTDGGTFDFLQIDLAEVPSLDSSGNPILSPPFDITFYGTKANGRAVTRTATLSNRTFSLERFWFEKFDDLVQVSWFQDAGSTPGHQFDNVVVSPR